MLALIRIVFSVSIIIIFCLSVVNASEIPNIARLSFVSDKVIHAFIYFYLTLLGLFSRFNISELSMVIIIFMFGSVIEVIHYFHPYRYFEIADLIANLIGILAAILIFNKKNHIRY